MHYISLPVAAIIAFLSAQRVTSDAVVYVSQVSGNDSDSCGSLLWPCRTISRAIDRASPESTIYLDGTKTTQEPFKCQPLTSYHRGIYVNKSLSFVGIRSRAHIACDKGQEWVMDGRNSTDPVDINFTRLVFENSRLHFIDTSVEATQCVFSNTEKLVMNFTIIHRNLLSLSLDDVAFKNNEACMSVTSKSTNSGQKQIYIDITSSIFDKNGLRNVPILSYVQSTVLWLDCTGNVTFIDISVKNASFNENFVRAHGMIYLRNERGQTNFLLEGIDLVANGRHDSRAANSLFVIWCPNVTFTIQTSRALKNIARLLSLSGSSTRVSVSNSIIDTFSNPLPHGGVFYIESNVLSLSINNCSLSNERNNPGHGGACYIAVQNTSIVIQNSKFSSLKSSGYGAVLYVSSHKHERHVVKLMLTMKNSSFTYNSAMFGGVIDVDLPLNVNVTTTVKNCIFVSNKALAGGGVMRFSQGTAVKLVLLSTIFEGNIANGSGGVIFVAWQSNKGNYFSLTARNVRFLQNQAGGPGGVMSLPPSRVTSLYFHNVSMDENLSQAGPGGVLYVRGAIGEVDNSSVFHLSANDVHFTKNTAIATPGGALFLQLNTKAVVLSFEKVSFTDNRALKAFGGAMYVSSNVTSYAYIRVSRCLFVRNSAYSVGGAIFLEGRGMFASKDTTFESNVAVNPGGAIFLVKSNSAVSLINTTFYNNSCVANPGGAVYLDIRNRSTVNITHTSFKSNQALKAFGGAILMKMSEDLLNQSGCERSSLADIVPRRSWIYSNTIFIQNTQFEGNIATGGGALSVTNGAITIRSCIFLNNFASVQGGHIINYGSNSLQVYDSVIQQTIASVSEHGSKFYLPSFIQTYSAGPFVLVNSTVDHQASWTPDPLIMVSKGGLVDFDNFSSVVCPLGSFVSKLNLSYPDRENETCTIQVTVLRFSCQQCNPGLYSLKRGHTNGLKIAQDFACIACPYGADCSSLIKSKPNFWGYVTQTDPQALNFTFCPLGYCQPPKQNSSDYNACHGNRVGFMCGECAPGYTEGLFSTDCKLVKKCTDHWFWLCSLALVLTIAIFLIHKPPIITFAVKQVFWFKTLFVCRNPMPAGSQRGEVLPSSSDGVESTVKRQSTGFLKIIFYFYQISNLLITFTSVGELAKSKFIPPIVGFFNFQQRFTNQGLVCPFPGLTPQTKKLFEIIPLFSTLFAIYVMYGLHCILSQVLSRTTPRLGPYLGATMETLLLGYATVAKVSLLLVRCVPIGLEKRWFYNGTLVCFLGWQYLLIVFIATFVVPFIFVLAWGSVKLYFGEVSPKQLLSALVFPPFFLAFWLFRLIRRNASDFSQQNEYTEALKEVLHEPFREPETCNKGALYWESVLIGRRFVLISLYCFVTEPSTRLLCMTFVCVLALLHHLKVRSFRNPHANTAETMSLLCLVILAIINMYKAVIMAAEGQIKGPYVEIFLVFDWIEILLIGFIPTLFFLMITLGFFSLAARVVFSFCRSLYQCFSAACLRCSSDQPDGHVPLLDETSELHYI